MTGWHLWRSLLAWMAALPDEPMTGWRLLLALLSASLASYAAAFVLAWMVYRAITLSQ